MQLLPWPELEEIAKVLTAGAKKYGPDNWQDLPDGYQRYKGAMLRHLTEVEKGIEIDADTGCMHAAQVATNAIFMLYFKMKEFRESYNSDKQMSKEPLETTVGRCYEHHQTLRPLRINPKTVILVPKEKCTEAYKEDYLRRMDRAAPPIRSNGGKIINITPDELRQAMTIYKTHRELANHFKVSTGTIGRRIRKYRLNEQ